MFFQTKGKSHFPYVKNILKVNNKLKLQVPFECYFIKTTNKFHLYSFSLQSGRPSPFFLSFLPFFQSISTTKITTKINKEVRADHQTQGKHDNFL